MTATMRDDEPMHKVSDTNEAASKLCDIHNISCDNRFLCRYQHHHGCQTNDPYYEEPTILTTLSAIVGRNQVSVTNTYYLSDYD